MITASWPSPSAWTAVVVVAFGLLLDPVDLAAGTNLPPARTRSSVERMALERLKSVHEDVLRLRSRRTAPPGVPGVNDYTCILHAHAEDSAHTGGTLPEMLADAKLAGVSAVLLSDHFRAPRDFIDGRWRGLRDGVLFIPGSEVRGFLVHPMASILDRMDQSTPEFVKTVTAGEGLLFLSHIEERPDHSMEGLTGLEIYNRHWDAKRDMASVLALVSQLTDPASLATLEEAVRLYPDEMLAFQCDYPQAYLDKWDASTRTQRLTGVAANDCHHNQVFLVKRVDDDTVLVGTVVDRDDQMRKVTAALRPGIRQMTRGRKAGDTLARVDLDPYHRSFRNSCTHVLAPRLDEAAIRAALKSGHAYVSHDWMGDPKGFDFAALGDDGRRRAGMGDELALAGGVRLAVRLPIPAHVRLLRAGEEVATWEDRTAIEFTAREAGAYRIEAWLRLDGEPRPWLFSNPIYLR